VTPRRASSAVFSLLLASSAAAQVRTIPTEAVSAPLSVRAPSGSAASIGSAALAPSAGFSAGFAPEASAFSAPEAAAPPTFAPSAAAFRVSAAPLAAAPPRAANSPAPATALLPIRPARATAAAPAKTRATNRGADSARSTHDVLSDAPRADAAILFDGASERAGFPAAADGPDRAPALPRAALPRGRLRRALGFAGVAVPAAVLVGVAGAVTPHAALIGVHWLGQAAYWLANPFAFMFTVPQIHRMLSRRSADVSAGMIAVGLAATATAAVNFAFDSKDLMMYRNLAQMFGFGAMAVLQWRYSRAPGQAAPSKRRALIETGAVAFAVIAAMFLIGPTLLAAVPGIAVMNSLLIPLQVASGFGFTYMMYAQLSKMLHARSSGDSSPAMMWAFLATKTIWVWSLATMVSLATAPAWLTLPAAVGFAAICWLTGKAALTRLLKAPWAFLPEKIGFAGAEVGRDRLVDIASFVTLSALILILSSAGYFGFVDVLGVPAAAASRFAMYLLYMVQSLVACLATLKTLRLQKRYKLEKTTAPERSRP
jgi:hypothetical protein